MTKTVLITGAAVRIGREIALSMADDGWDVAIHYNRSQKEAAELASCIEQKKRTALLVQADLRDEQALTKLIPSLAEQGVALDCLVNNASLFERDMFPTFSQESWQAQQDVNLFAPLRLMQGFAAHYKGKEGNIINITDGMNGPLLAKAFFSYSVSKFALEQVTTLLVHELAPNIRINAVAAGASLAGKQDKQDTFDNLKKTIPLQRTSSPQEICDAVRYILSQPSLTGQVIALSGGVR